MGKINLTQFRLRPTFSMPFRSKLPKLSQSCLFAGDLVKGFFLRRRPGMFKLTRVRNSGFTSKRLIIWTTWACFSCVTEWFGPTLRRFWLMSSVNAFTIFVIYISLFCVLLINLIINYTHCQPIIRGLGLIILNNIRLELYTERRIT